MRHGLLGDRLRLACASALAACALGAPLGSAHAQDSAALQARHAALTEQLASNAFQRPLVLESTQTDGVLRGDVYAVVAQPFAVVGPGLQAVEHWCDILILHLNVKLCRTTGSGAASLLRLTVGTKYDQPMESAYEVDFRYGVAASAPDYLHVQLSADKGPMGTRDYRIVLEAVPLGAKQSFVHLSYAYGYGLAARLAMAGYLMTTGRNKVGFSVLGHQADGKPDYIAGVRGVVERNTMRYYLAIEAYVGALTAPAADQQEKRLADWFAAVERYPVQLHELERSDYLEMKHREIERQRVMGKAGGPG